MAIITDITEKDKSNIMVRQERLYVRQDLQDFWDFSAFFPFLMKGKNLNPPSAEGGLCGAGDVMLGW